MEITITVLQIITNIVTITKFRKITGIMYTGKSSDNF